MKLSTYLRDNGISASRAAREIGIATTSVTRLLGGERGVTAATAIKIINWSCGAVTLADLTSEAGNEDKGPSYIDPPFKCPPDKDSSNGSQTQT